MHTQTQNKDNFKRRHFLGEDRELNVEGTLLNLYILLRVHCCNHWAAHGWERDRQYLHASKRDRRWVGSQSRQATPKIILPSIYSKGSSNEDHFHPRITLNVQLPSHLKTRIVYFFVCVSENLPFSAISSVLPATHWCDVMSQVGKR